jgi:hypothetical protein
MIDLHKGKRRQGWILGLRGITCVLLLVCRFSGTISREPLLEIWFVQAFPRMLR